MLGDIDRQIEIGHMMGNQQNPEHDYGPRTNSRAEMEDLGNFAEADNELAKKINAEHGTQLTGDDIEKMRRRNNLTWNEVEGRKNIKLIPIDIHKACPYSGVVSAMQYVHRIADEMEETDIIKDYVNINLPGHDGFEVNDTSTLLMDAASSKQGREELEQALMADPDGLTSEPDTFAGERTSEYPDDVKQTLDDYEAASGETIFDGDPDAVTLEKGTMLERYGSNYGYYLTSKGTPEEKLSLPPSDIERDHHYYRVEKPFDVIGGKAAPAFGKPGGGDQYLTGRASVNQEHPEDSKEGQNVQQLLDGYLIEVDENGVPIESAGGRQKELKDEESSDDDILMQNEVPEDYNVAKDENEEVTGQGDNGILGQSNERTPEDEKMPNNGQGKKSGDDEVLNQNAMDEGKDYGFEGNVRESGIINKNNAGPSNKGPSNNDLSDEGPSDDGGSNDDGMSME